MQMRADAGPTSVFIPRSQSRDKARQIVGTMSYTHSPQCDTWWGVISLLGGYTQSFDGKSITQALFGINPCNNNQSILIQGSLVENRSNNAWLADYFYLPPDYHSRLSFDPIIRNELIDFDIYIGLDPWFYGMYARIFAPLVHTTWNLRTQESIINPGSLSYPAGYFAPTEIPRSQMVGSFLQFARGCTITENNLIAFNNLQFARIPLCAHSKTAFADIRLEFGWDFCADDCRHLGINIQCAVPTGNKPNACFVFSPIVGNGHHWELGGGLTAHQLMYENQSQTVQFTAHLDANITHLFGVFQERTFDVCCKPNSRYMLTALLDRPIENNLSASPTSNVVNQDDPVINPNAQFMNRYTPLANISTDFVKVSNSVQADIVVLFQFTTECYSLEFGYNFWAIGCERIECPEAGNSSCRPLSLCTSGQENRWAFKGDARMFGFMIENGTTLDEGAPVALSATERCATIYSGTNRTLTNMDATNDVYRRNFGVDTARFAYGDSSNTALEFEPLAGVDLERQIKTSLIPQFISCTDLNFQRLSGRSHKIFAHLSYQYPYCFGDIHIGAGGFGEFGSNGNMCSHIGSNGNMCSHNGTVLPTFNLRCASCLRASLSQWGVWIKGGFAF